MFQKITVFVATFGIVAGVVLGPISQAIAVTCTPSTVEDSKCFGAHKSKPRSPGKCKVSAATKTGSDASNGNEFWTVDCVQRPNATACSGNYGSRAVAGRCALEGSYPGQDCNDQSGITTLTNEEGQYGCPSSKSYLLTPQQDKPVVGGSCPCETSGVKTVSTTTVCDCS